MIDVMANAVDGGRCPSRTRRDVLVAALGATIPTRCVALVLMQLILAICGGLRAEDSPGTQPTLSEVKPEIWYLRDADGTLLPSPGFRYEDFVELMRLKEGLPAKPRQPDAIVDRMAIDATIDGRFCRVEIVFQIDCTHAGWASAFLAIPQLILDRPPVHEGAGRFVLEPVVRAARNPPGDAEGGVGRVLAEEGGYRAWFEGIADERQDLARHVIRLFGVVPVERSSSSQAIRLGLPRANTSVFRLKTALSDPIVEVTPDRAEVTVRPVGKGSATTSDPSGSRDGDEDDARASSSAAPADTAVPPFGVEGSDAVGTDEGTTGRIDGSLVTVLGLSGTVEVRLAARDSAIGPLDRPAQVIGEIIVRIDGRKAISDVTLSASGLPLNADRLNVRLPRGAAVTGARSPSRFIGTSQRDGEDVAEFAIEKVGGAAELHFTCESRVDSTGQEPLESLAYAVDGIASWRQWGRASVIVDGVWQVDWEPVAANRRVDPPPSIGQPEESTTPERSGTAAFAGAFAYDSQPASMPLRIRPLGTRMAVEPEYRYAVGTSRIELDARLRVSVRGAPINRLEIALPGWAIDDVGPAGLVDTSRLSGESGRLLIPFVRPLSGNATIELRAGRSIEPDATAVDWVLPVPRADLVGPAALTIVPQPNIELVPDAERTTGLVRQVIGQPSGRQGESGAIAYRMEGSEAGFHATRRFLGRRVDAVASIRAVVDVDDTVVEEVVRLDVAHLPLEVLQLAVPRAVIETGSLEVRHNGLLLSVMEQAKGDDESDDLSVTAAGTPATVQVVLPVPLLGPGELRVRYVLPTPEIPSETTVASELPIVVPLDARLARQSLTIEPNAGLTVDVRGDQWKRDLVLQGAAAIRSWTATKPQSMVPLAIAAEGAGGLGETTVEAAWITTRILPDRVHERFRYRVATASPVLSVTLPRTLSTEVMSGGSGGVAGDPWKGERVGLFVDGRSIPASVQAGGRLSVELSPMLRPATHVVEIDIVKPRPAFFEPLLLQSPTFAAGVVERRFVWEVRVESDDHVVMPPSGWNSQQAWRWTIFGVDRVPLVSQPDLQRWLFGATPAESPPLMLKERCSVYSGVGAPGRVRIRIAPSWLIVLVCSGGVLSAALSLLYVQSLRRPIVVIVLMAIGVLAAAVVPDQVPLMLMASLPGVLLAAVASLLRLIVEEPAVDALVQASEDRHVSFGHPTTGSSTRLLAPLAVPDSSLLISSSVASDGGGAS